MQAVTGIAKTQFNWLPDLVESENWNLTVLMNWTAADYYLHSVNLYIEAFGSFGTSLLKYLHASIVFIRRTKTSFVRIFSWVNEYGKTLSSEILLQSTSTPGSLKFFVPCVLHCWAEDVSSCMISWPFTLDCKYLPVPPSCAAGNWAQPLSSKTSVKAPYFKFIIFCILVISILTLCKLPPLK